jgi:hypothetical protein
VFGVFLCPYLNPFQNLCSAKLLTKNWTEL